MLLEGKSFAVLVEDGYEDLELWYPLYRLQEAGAEVRVLGTGKEAYTGKHGYEVSADARVGAADPDGFDGVIIPGGKAPERMVQSPDLLEFVRQMDARHKPIAFICHGAMVPAEAGLLNGRKVTSYPGLQQELERQGARWVDEEIVRDDNLISSRRPADLPAFCRDIIGGFIERGESSVPDHEHIRYY